MRGSDDRILTTHTGSLHRPVELAKVIEQKFIGAPYNESVLRERLRESVADVVNRQQEAGVDIVNDGEFSKSSWFTYATERMRGFEFGESKIDLGSTLLASKDGQQFHQFYADAAPHNGALFWIDDTSGPAAPRSLSATCVRPISYDDTAVRADIDNLKHALADTDVQEAFLAVTAPGSIQSTIPNEHYPDDESYLGALAAALNQEYRAIADAGLIVQVDDAFLPYAYDMRADWDVVDFRKWAGMAIEALNTALDRVPQESVRYHICRGSWNGPHSADLPLPEIVDLLLSVNAGAYAIEAANPRHAWEWKVWRDVPLPDGKILIPGVVEHCTNVVEHPETVAQRILRYADVVGRENVIAGTDCGYNQRIHPQLAWAKQKAMTAGAALATAELWGH